MKEDDAIFKFMNGLNCAQSVASSFCKELGVDEKQIMQITSGFGAGIARKQEVCGAVTGGIIALGLKYDTEEFRSKNKEIVFEKVNEFTSDFERIHGSIICRNLLNGIDLKAKDGQILMKERLKNDVCAKCVQSAVQILEKMI
jgi:C_GCAxxG_C_C family probable redox protein